MTIQPLTKLIALSTLILCTTSPLALAEVYNNEATPPVAVTPNYELLIQKVSFKNSTADFVEFSINPASTPLNLRGLEIWSDKLIKKIDYDLQLSSSTTLKLIFKSPNPDSPPQLFTTNTGLTGTTEQIYFRSADQKLLDAVCWTTTTPTKDEITDMQQLYTDGGWHSENPQSCFPSTSVAPNQAIIRLDQPDTNSSDNWEVEEVSQEKTVIDPEDSTSIKPLYTEIPVDNAKTVSSNTAKPTAKSSSTNKTLTTPKTVTAKTGTSSKKTPTKTSTTKKVTTTTKKKKATKNTYKNGDLSTDIIISELMPNPSGTDSKNEWIEITNTGENDINLGNWYIIDAATKPKPFILPDTVNLASSQSLLIPITESKLSLGNTADGVKIYDYTGTLIDEINYDKTSEAQSYASIDVLEDGEITREWIWTIPTPGEPNPQAVKVVATVTSAPNFDNKYSFIVSTDSIAEQKVQFTETVLPAALAQASIKKGSELTLTAFINPDNTWQLISYTITREAETTSSPVSYLWIATTLSTAGAATFALLRYFRSKKKTNSV